MTARDATASRPSPQDLEALSSAIRYSTARLAGMGKTAAKLADERALLALLHELLRLEKVSLPSHLGEARFRQLRGGAR